MGDENRVMGDGKHEIQTAPYTFSSTLSSSFHIPINYLHLQKYFLESFKDPDQKFKCRTEKESFKRS